MGQLVIYAVDKIAGQALCSLLRRRNLNPKYLQTTDELFEYFRLSSPCVIIVDLSSMSEMDNQLQEILQMTEDSPVILLTPYELNEKDIAPLQTKGYHMLEKPVVFARLIDLIRQLDKQ